VYPQQNSQFPSQPPNYGAQQQPFHYGFSPQQNQPTASVPIAGQNSGFTNNAFN
jgi:hypothetical protein